MVSTDAESPSSSKKYYEKETFGKRISNFPMRRVSVDFSRPYQFSVNSSCHANGMIESAADCYNSTDGEFQGAERPRLKSLEEIDPQLEKFNARVFCSTNKNGNIGESSTGAAEIQGQMHVKIGTRHGGVGKSYTSLSSRLLQSKGPNQIDTPSKVVISGRTNGQCGELMIPEKKRNLLAFHSKQILELLGEDTSREGLLKTPMRMADSLSQLTEGYEMNLLEVVNGALFDTDQNNLVIVRGIPIFSTCEHHLLPFFGKCHIGYIPNGKIIGLSKFARITDMFGRRLQVQERLCDQIAEAVDTVLNPAGVIVFIEAVHLCMMSRGVCKTNSETVTTCVRGLFKDASHRTEFFSVLSVGPFTSSDSTSE